MSINLKRVVVTGIGAVTPLGCGIEHVWQRILAGESGISKLPEFLNLSKEGVHVAGQVPQGEAEDPYSYNLKQVFGRNIGNEMSKITQYGVYASDLALKHAGMTEEFKNITDLISPENCLALYFLGYLEKKMYGHASEKTINNLRNTLDQHQYWIKRFDEFNLKVEDLTSNKVTVKSIENRVGV